MIGGDQVIAEKEGSVYKKGVRKTGRKSVLARLQSGPTNYKKRTSLCRPVRFLWYVQ